MRNPGVNGRPDGDRMRGTQGFFPLVAIMLVCVAQSYAAATKQATTKPLDNLVTQTVAAIEAERWLRFKRIFPIALFRSLLISTRQIYRNWPGWGFSGSSRGIFPR
jgi:hypothetical protein